MKNILVSTELLLGVVWNKQELTSQIPVCMHIFQSAHCSISQLKRCLVPQKSVENYLLEMENTLFRSFHFWIKKIQKMTLLFHEICKKVFKESYISQEPNRRKILFQPEHYSLGLFPGNQTSLHRLLFNSEYFLMYCASFLQVVLWFIMPAITSPNYNIKNTTFGLVIVVQYIIRMYLIVPLSNQIIKAAGVVAKTAWGGAAYNLLLYMLASHVCHSIQYILLQNHLFTHSSLQNPNFHICPSEI